ncbi:hypothetical protein GCM10027098_25610 [Bowmanella dokdonensis]
MPGFVFLGAFERRENTVIDRKPFDMSFGLAVFLAVLVHTLTLHLSSLIGNAAQLSYAVKLLTGTKLTDEDIQVITQNIDWITAYFLVTMVGSYALGKFSQYLVLKYSPYKNSLYSFDTPWYYELKGMLSSKQDAQLIKASCLLDLNSGSYLYYGIVDAFYLTKDGQPDRLVLENASRRKLDNDDTGSKPQELEGDPPAPAEDTSSPKDRFYQIKGDRLTLKYCEIKNLNLEYYYVYEKPIQ